MAELLRQIARPANPQGRGEALVVLLPGAYDRPEDFISHGFEAAARGQGLPADLLFVETDLTAVADGQLVRRVQHSVIAPARAAGYRHITLGGISLGGLTALIHADAFPGAVDALLLLAPYPGNRAITGEIEAAGGPARWNPGALAEDDGELRGWRALQRLGRQAAAPVWLGYGSEDRFAPAQRMMAGALPPERVAQRPGGHDWPTWAALWAVWLAQAVAR
jgi:pimeloyl-ACP methyl ester carboxylesterase